MIACSFTVGCFIMPHPNGKGKQQVWFEDSDQFGPSAVNMRTGDLTMISERHPWFWHAYTAWRSEGRPTDEKRARQTPNGLLQGCVIPPERFSDKARSDD